MPIQYVHSTKELYVMRVTSELLKAINKDTIIKVGESKNTAVRVKDLNSVNNVSFQLVCTAPLRHIRNKRKRLTDKTIRKYILKCSSSAHQLSSDLALMLGVNDGKSELIQLDGEWSDKALRDLVEEAFSMTQENDYVFHTEKKDIVRRELSELVVPIEYINKYKPSWKEILCIKNKSILMIRNFSVALVQHLITNENTITLITDNCTDVPILDNKSLTIKHVSDCNSIMEEVKLTSQFDLLIANPPYNKGNAIISECMNHCKKGVVLMPGSCYKDDELYKYVEKIETVDHSYFEQDGAVIRDLTLANVSCCKNAVEWSNFINYRYDSFVKDYVDVNKENKHMFIRMAMSH